MMDFKIKQLTNQNKNFYLQNVEVSTNFDYIDDFLKDPNTFLFFATNDSDVLGTVYGYQLTRMNSKPMMYIHSIDVYEKYQQLGIGTALIETCKKYAVEQAFIKIFLITNKSNQKAMGLYQKTLKNTPHQDDIIFEWKKEQS